MGRSAGGDALGERRVAIGVWRSQAIPLASRNRAVSTLRVHPCTRCDRCRRRSGHAACGYTTPARCASSAASAREATPRVDRMLATALDAPARRRPRTPASRCARAQHPRRCPLATCVRRPQRCRIRATPPGARPACRPGRSSATVRCTLRSIPARWACVAHRPQSRSRRHSSQPHHRHERVIRPHRGSVPATWKRAHSAEDRPQRRTDLVPQLPRRSAPNTRTTCGHRSRTDEFPAPRRSVRRRPTHGRLAPCGN